MKRNFFFLEINMEVILQTVDISVVRPEGFNAFEGCCSGRNCGETRNVCLIGFGANHSIIMARHFTQWGIDDEVHLSVFDEVYNVWATFMDFVHAFHRQSMSLEQFVSAFGGDKREAHAD